MDDDDEIKNVIEQEVLFFFSLATPILNWVESMNDWDFIGSSLTFLHNFDKRNLVKPKPKFGSLLYPKPDVGWRVWPQPDQNPTRGAYTRPARLWSWLVNCIDTTCRHPQFPFLNAPMFSQCLASIGRFCHWGKNLFFSSATITKSWTEKRHFLPMKKGEKSYFCERIAPLSNDDTGLVFFLFSIVLFCLIPFLFSCLYLTI